MLALYDGSWCACGSAVRRGDSRRRLHKVFRRRWFILPGDIISLLPKINCASSSPSLHHRDQCTCLIKLDVHVFGERVIRWVVEIRWTQCPLWGSRYSCWGMETSPLIELLVLFSHCHWGMKTCPLQCLPSYHRYPFSITAWQPSTDKC